MNDDNSSEHGSARQTWIVAALAATVAAIAIAAAVYFLVIEKDDPVRNLESLDLAAPVDFGDGQATDVRILIDKVRSGSNEISVAFGNTLAPESQVNPGVESAIVTATRIDAEDNQSVVDLQPNSEQGLGPGEIRFENNGWWTVSASLTMTSGDTITVPFYVLVPDPNVNGFESVPDHDSTDIGTALFNRGMQTMTSRHSMGYLDRLSAGTGTVAPAQRLVSDGWDGNPPTDWLEGELVEILTIGETTWQRAQGEAWFERTPIEVFPPSDWGRLYDGATDFTTGLPDIIRSRPAQTVMFHVPATDTFVAAWYVWWIDVETGDVLREAMISRLHYMVYEFYDFDEPVVFEPPIDIPPPAATPEATPTT